MPTRQQLIFAAQLTVLVGSTSVAVLSSRASDWQPTALVLLLLFLAVGSDQLTMDWRGLRISSAFLALVLSMALLGPAPAAAIGVVTAIVDMVLSPRRSWDKTLNNIVVFHYVPVGRRSPGQSSQRRLGRGRRGNVRVSPPSSWRCS